MPRMSVRAGWPPGRAAHSSIATCSATRFAIADRSSELEVIEADGSQEGAEVEESWYGLFATRGRG